MSINTVDIILMIVAGVCFLVAAGMAFMDPPVLRVTAALTALGLLFWSIVPLIEFIRVA